MPSSGGGFAQAYHTRAGVDMQTYLIVKQHVTQHTNYKQEIDPAMNNIAVLPDLELVQTQLQALKTETTWPDSIMIMLQ